MATNPDEAGIPAASENFRQTGARKLEARLEEPSEFPRNYAEKIAVLKEPNSHLMEPVNENQEETRVADGRNPPGSFGTEADPRIDARESSPDAAAPSQNRRPD